MKRNAIAIILAAFLLIVFAVQCRFPGMTTYLAVHAGSHDAYRLMACLFIHGSALHVVVNSAALVILLYGFGRKTSAFLIAHAMPAALCAVWIYSTALMPTKAWLCGSSPLIYALFGLIAWQERKTSIFSLFGIRHLSLPLIPMLGVVLLCDAAISSTFFSFIAWPVHTLSGLGGLVTGILLSLLKLRNPLQGKVMEMNKVTALIAVMATVILTGCSLFLSPDRPGYQAGRTTAVVWMATENVQPKELHAACITGYRVLQAVYGRSDDVSLMDQAATAAVSKMLGESASDAQKQLVMNFYTMARNRLEGVVSDKADRLTVLANFTAGIEDALKDYGYTKN